MDEELTLNKKNIGDIKFVENNSLLTDPVDKRPDYIGFVGCKWQSETKNKAMWDWFG